MSRLNPLRRQTLALLGGLAASPLTCAATRPRLVSVGGALTEMVYALQAEADLVGVDTTSLYPPQARSLPSVGYARALSAEGVLALAPTQVIATEDAGPPAVLRQLAASGVPLTVLAANHRFDGMLDRLARVGALTGRATQAEGLATMLRREWQAAQRQVADRVAARRGPRPRVLFVLSHSVAQVMVGGSATSAQAMVEYAGARNALAGVSGYKPLTPEAAIAAAPDLLLATDQGMQAAGGIDAFLRLPGLGETPAGRARRVVTMDAMLLLGFGPRLPLALKQLDEACAAAWPA